MKLIFPIFTFFLTISALGQQSVTDLNPSHATALEEFLSKNKNYGFMSEKVIPAEDLSFMRSFLGKKLTPYYRVEKFNKDNFLDFAMILSRKGNVKENDHPIVVVIFNGKSNGTFQAVFTEEIEAPLTCFLNFQDKKLYFAVSESDADPRIFTPAGKGYIVEYETEYP